MVAGHQPEPRSYSFDYDSSSSRMAFDDSASNPHKVSEDYVLL